MSVQPDDVPWLPFAPAEVAQLLRGVEAPWAVAAGHAVDLFLGKATREHEDLEIAVPADRFPEVAAALGLEFHVPVAPGVLTPLAARPLAEVESHQTWGLDPAVPAWRIDVFREPSTGSHWVCRRDPGLVLPYADVIEHGAGGIPYVRPELVLLFKAKAVREKDDADFDAVVPRLSANRSALLAEWLGRVHPGHAWLQRLSIGTKSRSS